MDGGNLSFRMLSRFEGFFRGKIYRHRSSHLGDQLALDLYEDLYALDRSTKFIHQVDGIRRGVNIRNVRVGVEARRGDGTLGEFVPGAPVIDVSGYRVRRGRVATLDIGVEVKILNKAMIKQINDRIAGLQKQAEYFEKGRDGRRRGNPISIAVIAVNHAPFTVGYEGDRQYKTDGRQHAHPKDEAAAVERRIRAEVVPHFEETILLRYSATNESPFPFGWVDESATRHEYAAGLVRVAAAFESRF